MKTTSLQWTGRILSTLLILFLWVDSLMKLVRAAIVLQTSGPLGLPDSLVTPIGIILLLSTLLYAIPQTSVMGAIVLTGYLGGAVAMHLRVADSLFSHTLFPVYLGILLWVALVLRSPRLRQLLPLRQPS